MAGQFSGLFIMLPCLYFMKKIDFEDPENLFRLRLAFTLITTAIFAVIAYLYFRIKQLNDRRIVIMPAQGAADPNSQSTRITVMKHDLDQLKKFLSSHTMGTVITCFIHFKFGIIPPLFIQCVMNPFQASQNPLVKLYLLGYTTPDLVNRPWKADASPLASLFGGGQPEQQPSGPPLPADSEIPPSAVPPKKAPKVEEVTNEAPTAPTEDGKAAEKVIQKNKGDKDNKREETSHGNAKKSAKEAIVVEQTASVDAAVSVSEKNDAAETPAATAAPSLTASGDEDKSSSTGGPQQRKPKKAPKVSD